ncbi:membrane dipeptidase [Mucilaginibacter terrenus]|uniref:Membrane dipeptidase n=1 Tax=Mucilaginibacter terrenus TaxID=2482727 RepID=A0A3E2NU77_9SPHI|nr:dipeptidase [Mucilaginibacter terrenus]RFZ84562.1 membrane dipeptidase [Mucilaginibacter terrenus]
MKKLFFILFMFSASQLKAQDVNKIHQNAILVDTHNDAISNELITKNDLGKLQTTGNFDLVRAKQAGLDVQVFSIWCGDQYSNGTAYAFANREIDSVLALINRNPDRTVLVRTAKDLKKAVKQDKMAAMLGVEGGHMIEDRLDYIDSLAKRGMCYLTLTWNNSTNWASSARDEVLHKERLKQTGLTDFGRQVVHKLNDMGIMIDLSHPGEQTFKDVMAITTKPVIASHSCAYALCQHRRNLKDYQLKAIAKNGGVVFVNFYSGFIDSTYDAKHEAYLARHKPELDSLIKVYNDYDLASIRLNVINKKEADQLRPPLSMLIKHIDYMVKLMGVDHVGIGSDFDGAESYPLGLDSVTDYPKVTAELLKLGYSEKDLRKIMGENFIRVLKANKGK